MLGDLPTIGLKGNNNPPLANQKDIEVALSLQVNDNKKKLHDFMKQTEAKGEGSPNSKKADPSIPKDFVCSINQHVMKEPVRAKTTGLVFEKTTIELWLATRGSVCPITNSPLEKSDLEPAEDLRNQ